MMNYSTTLTRCILISCIALLAMSAFPIHPALPFLAGIAPLLWYHLLFLRPIARSQGLSQAAIDSVYYYGFLVTIAALAASSLQLATHGIEGDFTAIAFQFGLGLIATGYAVWARIQLTAASQRADEAGPEEMLDRYLQRSRELVTNVELATGSFSVFAERLTVSAAQTSARAQEDTLAAVRDAAVSFRNEIASLAEEGRQAIGGLRGLVNDVTFGAEREEMKRGVRSITASVASLNKGMQTLSSSATSSAEDVGKFAGALASVRDTAGGVAGQLGKLSEDHGPIARLSVAIDAGTLGFSRAGEVIATAVQTVDAAAVGATGAIGALAESAELASEVRTRLTSLVEALARVDAIGEGVNAAAGALARLGEEGGRSGIAVTELAVAITALNEMLNGTNVELGRSGQRLVTAMAETDARLRKTLEGSSTAVETLSGRLATIADHIIERTSHRPA